MRTSTRRLHERFGVSRTPVREALKRLIDSNLVLVDPLREYPDAGLPWTRWCHMVSDVDFAELHAFATGLGIAFTVLLFWTILVCTGATLA